MDNSLMMNPEGNNKLTRADRARNTVNRKIVGDVQTAGLKVDGAAALCGHIMTRAEELDDDRRKLARGDVVLDCVLAEFEATFISQCKAIQRSVHNPWGLS
jgi:hypothetical protein